MWGEQGRFLLPITPELEDAFCEAYGATDDINDVIIPEQQVAIGYLYPAINFLINLWRTIRHK